MELTGDNIVLNYCLLDTTCFTYVEDNFSSHQFVWQKADCSTHHCTNETMWSWPRWQNCCQEITAEETKQCQMAPVGHWTIEQWNKVLWTNESMFEIFGPRVYMWWRVGERAATPWMTPIVKHGGRSLMVWRVFTNCKNGYLHKLNPTGNKIKQLKLSSSGQLSFWLSLNTGMSMCRSP